MQSLRVKVYSSHLRCQTQLGRVFRAVEAVNGIWMKPNLDGVDLPMRMTRSGNTTLH